MVAFEEDHVFQELAPLGSAENLVVGWAQGIRLNRVKPCSHLGVTRCPFYAEDGLQIVGFGDPSTVERKEAWILEIKHRIARHEAIRQGDFEVTVAHFGNLLEGLSNGPIECVCIQMLAHPYFEEPPSIGLALSQELSPCHGDLTCTTTAGLSGEK